MKSVLHIADALKQNRGHISFHTPGHKRTCGGDLTELSYTDNLSSPTGAIARAEEDIARILGAEKSFILTDGSTSGVMSMLYALKRAGANSVALSPYSHKSVKNGCMLCGLKAVEITVRTSRGIPLQPSVEEIARALSGADALLLTSPDYYGFFPPLKEARNLTKTAGKPLLLDGAHGAHLHFTGQVRRSMGGRRAQVFACAHTGRGRFGKRRVCRVFKRGGRRVSHDFAVLPDYGERGACGQAPEKDKYRARRAAVKAGA